MNQRNKKHSLWYSLGLGVLLCIAVLVVSTGTAYARYRTERTKTVKFAVREREQIVLGTELHTVTSEEATDELPEGTVVLEAQENLVWEDVDGTSRLTVVIGNGTSKYQYSQRDQQVQVRLLGTLGVWDGEKPVEMKLTVEQAENTEELLAVSSSLEEGTALHYTFGDGWVYTFQSEEGELRWELPGGGFNTIRLSITMEGVTPNEAAALQFLVTAEVTD